MKKLVIGEIIYYFQPMMSTRKAFGWWLSLCICQGMKKLVGEIIYYFQPMMFIRKVVIFSLCEVHSMNS
jgi:hypothetical protein